MKNKKNKYCTPASFNLIIAQFLKVAEEKEEDKSPDVNTWHKSPRLSGKKCGEGKYRCGFPATSQLQFWSER